MLNLKRNVLNSELKMNPCLGGCLTWSYKWQIYSSTRETITLKLWVSPSQKSISIAHRLPEPRRKSFHPSIVVQFVSRSTKAEWISAAKKKRIKTTDLAASLPPAPVLVLDHLTPQNKHILGRATSLVKDGQLAFAWSRDGKVLVRQTVDSPARRVRSIDEVEVFVRPAVSGSPTTTK
ncbi:hypothetical protein J6590_086112 [Homalodisca vitripennis]|nr:hypothetical protein J6590_086112 [Homalodisca vitripennis]